MVQSLEIFTGAGGLAMGLQRAGFSHAALIDRDKHSCATLRNNIKKGYRPIEDWNVIESDVRVIDYSQFGTSIKLIAGGPPCQPFSLGGKHRAYNDRRDMFPEAVRAVRELKPDVFVFENVKGLLRKSFATYFSYILLQLEYPEIERCLGEEWVAHLSRLEKTHTSGKYAGVKYNVVFQILNAADYGIPQMRHRVIIVGFRNSLGIDWSFPLPTHTREALLFSKWVSGEYWDNHRIAKEHRPVVEKHEMNQIDAIRSNYQYSLFPALPWRTVRDAICDLPQLDSGNDGRIQNHELRKEAKAYLGHTGSVLDEPSKAIKAGDHGVPGGENAVLLDDGSMRYYSVRETARLQSFPDDYVFYGSWTENMRQLGNAVPVDLAAVIGDSIMRTLLDGDK
jgi:DNA (cytosine-5)-methyltransferase 1